MEWQIHSSKTLDQDHECIQLSGRKKWRIYLRFLKLEGGWKLHWAGRGVKTTLSLSWFMQDRTMANLHDHLFNFKVLFQSSENMIRIYVKLIACVCQHCDSELNKLVKEHFTELRLLCLCSSEKYIKKSSPLCSVCVSSHGVKQIPGSCSISFIHLSCFWPTFWW